MDFVTVLEAANLLSREDRIRLVEAIWQSIEADQDNAELTEEFKQELDRRMAAYEANPDRGVEWEVVRAQALARWKRSDSEQAVLDATLSRRLEEIESGKEAGVPADEFLEKLCKEFP